MTRLPRLLCILGVTAVALGGVGRYVTRALFDPDDFASRAASSLRDPRVSAFVATEISDAAIRERPDLIAVRPLLVGVSEGIVSSEAGRALARRAARSVHQGLFSEGGRDVLLSIPDVGILLQSALASANPQLAAKVPRRISELGVSLEKTQAGRMAVAAARAGRLLARVSWSLLAVGFLLLLGGILLAPSRRQAVILVGAAFVVASLVVLALHPLGRWAVASRAEPAVRPLVAGLWDAFMGGLRRGALALAGLGVVLAAAGTSLLERIDIRRSVEAAWRWIESPPGGTGTRLLRALLAFAVGLAGLWWPRAVRDDDGPRLRRPSRLRGLARAVPSRPGRAARARRRRRGGAQVAAIAARDAGGCARGRRSRRRRRPPDTERPAERAGRCARSLQWRGSPVRPDSRHRRFSDGPQRHGRARTSRAGCSPTRSAAFPGCSKTGSAASSSTCTTAFPVGDRVKTDIDSEIGSKDRFEKAVGKEGIDAAMRIRDRMEGQAGGSTRGSTSVTASASWGAGRWSTCCARCATSSCGIRRRSWCIVIEDYVPPSDLEAAFTESGLVDFVYRSPLGPPGRRSAR